MGALRSLIGGADRWQRRHRVPGAAWGVVRKFSDDQANLLVVALGWYGFTAIYPLLLVVVTVFGYVGAKSLGTGIVSTLHQFPVIGSQFNPGTGSSSLHGSIFGLIIGLAGLLYGAQGVTQTAQAAMDRVWNVPRGDRPGFVPRLGRSLASLTSIGGAFLVNALVGSLTTGAGRPWWVTLLGVVGLAVLNVGFYLLTFRLLTPDQAGADLRTLLPGAVLGAVAFTALITVGSGLIQHQLRHSSATYGAFASVIGVVTFLLLLAKLSVYAAELNPVVARGLYPRALPTGEPTEADDRVLAALAGEQRKRSDEHVGVRFGDRPGDGVEADLTEFDAPGAAAPH